jgi:hypothetical protein
MMSYNHPSCWFDIWAAGVLSCLLTTRLATFSLCGAAAPCVTRMVYTVVLVHGQLLDNSLCLPASCYLYHLVTRRLVSTHRVGHTYVCAYPQLLHPPTASPHSKPLETNSMALIQHSINTGVTCRQTACCQTQEIKE